LPWPVRFVDAAHNIAQNYVQFQDYGDGAYYHKGCDLRSHYGEDVIAPISGTLEGGYYAYETHPDGSQTKFMKPWPGAPHDDLYFELAVVTPDGFRFELHHVDSMRLTSDALHALNTSDNQIAAGTRLGSVVKWPYQPGRGAYDHIHYNVIRNDGLIMNPEYYSAEVSDHVAPRIHGVFGVAANGEAAKFESGRSLPLAPVEIVVAATETRENSAYVQTPPLVAVAFANDPTPIAWDFRQFLATSSRWPDLREVFAPQIRTRDGVKLETFGQYGAGMFLFRLKLKPGQTGPFRVTVGDTYGNNAIFEAALQ
jgi:hypothetical protein